MATLVLTAIGEDRPGLVTAMSDLVAEHGGNWEESRMAELAGKFAGIVLVTVPDEQADALVAALSALRDRGLLDVHAEQGGERRPGGATEMVLELVGTDRPGIVREISAVLASLGVSIEELSTSTQEAPMAGGTIFEARAVLSLPADADLHEVRAALEAVADELMVDLALPSVPDADS
ncbi:MAG: glycine cleavage system protein R [Acidimicrobiales bacterium]